MQRTLALEPAGQFVHYGNCSWCCLHVSLTPYNCFNVNQLTHSLIHLRRFACMAAHYFT